MKKPKIAFAGVGYAGTKVVNKIVSSDLSEEIKTISVNAFEYDTRDSNTDVKIVLYKGKSRGLYQPIPPSRARDATPEAYDEIVDALKW